MEAATYLILSIPSPGDLCITGVVALEAQAQDAPSTGLATPLFCALILLFNKSSH